MPAATRGLISSLGSFEVAAELDSNPRLDGTTSTAVGSVLLLLSSLEASVAGSSERGTVSPSPLSELVGSSSLSLEENKTNGRLDFGIVMAALVGCMTASPPLIVLVIGARNPSTKRWWLPIQLSPCLAKRFVHKAML